MSARMKTLTLAIVALLASTLAFHAHAQACAQYDEVQVRRHSQLLFSSPMARPRDPCAKEGATTRLTL